MNKALILLRRWPDWVGYATAAWSSVYGLLGLYWATGGSGFPFGAAALNRRSGSVLEGSDVHLVAPAMAVLGLLGAVVATVLARLSRGNRATPALLAFGWVMAATLTLVIPDYFLLALIAFAPVLLVFAFTGVPGPQDGLGDILYWHRTNLIVLFAGGLLWAVTTVVHHRRARGACAYCGRAPGAHGGATRETLLRWCRRAVLISTLAPVPYEITRVSWFLGIPLGIPADFLRMMQQTPGMLEVGLGCAVASALGGVLTHGLVHGWGERYPRWIWFKAGRRIPPALAAVPAGVVALVLIPAGLMNLWTRTYRSGWATNVPSILWIVWGAALGAAAFLYYLRRRGACRHCGRGDAAGPRGGTLIDADVGGVTGSLHE